jgi:hypothetical protein
MSDVPPLGPFWTEDGPPTVDEDAVRPEVDDVAALCRTRTVDSSGQEQATFTPDTRPTSAEVEDLIDQALVDVLAQLPDHFDPIWCEGVKRAVAVRTANAVEVSYYRDSVEVSVPAQAWASQFTADLQALQSLIPKATYLA